MSGGRRRFGTASCTSMAAITRCVAPRWAWAKTRAASPMAVRRGTSRNRCNAACISSDAFSSCSAAPALIGVRRRLSKVEGMRPHQHRPPHARRLDQILPAQRHQAAADESHVARRVVRKQFAEAVAQQHPRLRVQQAAPPIAAALVRQVPPPRSARPPRRNAADGAAPAPAAHRPARSSAKARSSGASSPSRVLAASSTGRDPQRSTPGCTAFELSRRRRDVELEIADYRAPRARPAPPAARHRPRSAQRRARSGADMARVSAGSRA